MTSLVEKYNHLVEYLHVLAKTGPFFGFEGLGEGQQLGNDEEQKQFDAPAQRYQILLHFWSH